jgi:hypothetical protein
MAFIHGRKSTVLYGDSYLSEYLNEFSISHTLETGETTTFSSDAKTYIPGLRDGTVQLQGLFDGDARASDEVLQAAFASDAKTVMTVSPLKSAVGAMAYLVDAHTGSYEVSSPVADVVAAGADVQADGGIERGVLLTTGADVSATGNVTASDAGASSTGGGVGHLHVTANNRDGTVVVKIQDSADNIAFVDLVTFTTVPATTTTSQRLAVTGTVNRYLRASFTVAGSTGSATVYVAFARR